MNERAAVKWCAKSLDDAALRRLLSATKKPSRRALTNRATATFDSDLQRLLAALPRASLVHLVEAWAAETTPTAKVVGVSRTTVGELKAALTVFLIDEWRIPVEQNSATPVAGGRLMVVRGPSAPVSTRLPRATWFTERWRQFVGERQFTSELLAHDYPELIVHGETLLLQAEQDYLRLSTTYQAETPDGFRGV